MILDADVVHFAFHSEYPNKKASLLPKLYWIWFSHCGDSKITATQRTDPVHGILMNNQFNRPMFAHSHFSMAHNRNTFVCTAINEQDNQSRIENESRRATFFYWLIWFTAQLDPLSWYFLRYFNHIINKLCLFLYSLSSANTITSWHSRNIIFFCRVYFRWFFNGFGWIKCVQKDLVNTYHDTLLVHEYQFWNRFCGAKIWFNFLLGLKITEKSIF